MLSKQQSSQSRLIASAGCEAADKHLDFFKSAFEVKQFPKHWSFLKIPDVEVECWVTELRWTKLRCVRATHTYCGLKQPGQQQQKEGWCPHHVRVVLLWVFLWRLGGAELRHPQPLLQSVLFHFSTESASPPSCLHLLLFFISFPLKPSPRHLAPSPHLSSSHGSSSMASKTGRVSDKQLSDFGFIFKLSGFILPPAWKTDVRM